MNKPDLRYALYNTTGDHWKGKGGRMGSGFSGRNLYKLHDLRSSLRYKKWFNAPNPNHDVVVYELVEVGRIPAKEFFKDEIKKNGRSKRS